MIKDKFYALGKNFRIFLYIAGIICCAYSIFAPPCEGAYFLALGLIPGFIDGMYYRLFKQMNCINPNNQ